LVKNRFERFFPILWEILLRQLDLNKTLEDFLVGKFYLRKVEALLLILIHFIGKNAAIYGSEIAS